MNNQTTLPMPPASLIKLLDMLDEAHKECGELEIVAAKIQSRVGKLQNTIGHVESCIRSALPALAPSSTNKA